MAPRRRKSPKAARGALRPPSSSTNWAAVLLSAALVVIYLLNGDVQVGNDAVGALRLPTNLVTQGTLTFSPSTAPDFFLWRLRGEPIPEFHSMDDRLSGVRAGDLYASGSLTPDAAKYFVVKTRRQNAAGEPLYVSTFGIGAGLAAAPVLVPLQWMGDLRGRPFALWYGGKCAASLMVAFSACFVFLSARRFLSLSQALLIAGAYGVGTDVWSTSSQTLWQHGPNELFLAIGIYCLFRLHEHTRFAVIAGVAFSAAVACRPTSLIIFAAVALDLLIRERRSVVAYLMGALPLGLLLCVYNTYYLGAPWRFGQEISGASIALAKTGIADVWQTPLLTGLAGLLVSPSRGLFVFSPFLVFALWGAFVCFRDDRYQRFQPLVLGVAAIIVIEAKHFDWWGGWSFGYRHIVDTVVVLSLLLTPILGRVLTTPLMRAVFFATVAYSVGVQTVGAFAYDVIGWNARTTGVWVQAPSAAAPVFVPNVAEAQAQIRAGARFISEESLDIDKVEHRHRLWSIEDNEILYYCTHFQEARDRKKLLIRGLVGN